MGSRYHKEGGRLAKGEICGANPSHIPPQLTDKPSDFERQSTRRTLPKTTNTPSNERLQNTVARSVAA
jgi:hypothetical protein